MLKVVCTCDIMHLRCDYWYPEVLHFLCTRTSWTCCSRSASVRAIGEPVSQALRSGVHSNGCSA